MTRVLLTGAAGQLGQALQATAPAHLEVIAADRSRLDVTSAAAVDAACAEVTPVIVINAAAWTDVDGAQERADAAFAVNRDGAANVARAARDCGAWLLHLSTDYVFDGTSTGPYHPEQSPRPLGTYGESKLAGERMVRVLLPRRSLVLRTAWLYGPTGSNFVLTMLRLMRAGQPLRVVADQVGTPTSTHSLAAAIWQLCTGLDAEDHTGIGHYTDAGVASWYDFAIAVQEEAVALGLLGTPVSITPVATVDYPTLAPRPSWSVLDSREVWAQLAQPPPHWRVALRAVLEAIARG
jgi:dTDP-4-dehydrorhamnose reductase